MIKFSLKCAQDHRFDSWFQSADAYDKLARAGMIGCAVCGDTDVQKTIMAPSVQSGSAPVQAPRPERPLSAPRSPAEQALSDLRRRIEAHSEYVGPDFARAARDMHEGTAPERPIHGEARTDEARKLIEDGVPVLPLPFRPARKLS